MSDNKTVQVFLTKRELSFLTMLAAMDSNSIVSAVDDYHDGCRKSLRKKKFTNLVDSVAYRTFDKLSDAFAKASGKDWSSYSAPYLKEDA